MNKLLSDVHTYFIVSITSIVLIAFNMFGFLGLILYALLLIYSILFLLNKIKQNRILTPPIFFVMVAYYLYFFLAVCINGSVIQLGSSILQLFLFSLIAFSLRNTNEMIADITSAAKIVTIASLTMAIGSISIALFTYYNLDYVHSLHLISNQFIKITGNFPTRLSGFNLNPNGTAEFCLVGIISSYFILTFSRKTKWIILAIVNMIFSAYIIVIATNSRTNMVALAFFSLIYFILYFAIVSNKNKGSRKLAFYIIGCVLIVLIVILALLSSYKPAREFFLDKILRISSLSTASGRDSVYKTALHLGEGHRLFGYNIRTLKDSIAPHTHNMFLELLSFSGVPGLILFIIYYFFTLYIAIRNLLNKTLMHNEKAFCCFILCFILYYFVQGIPENAGVDSIRLSSVFAQLFFAFTHIIYYKNQQQKQMIQEGT